MIKKMMVICLGFVVFEIKAARDGRSPDFNNESFNFALHNVSFSPTGRPRTPVFSTDSLLTVIREGTPLAEPSTPLSRNTSVGSHTPLAVLAACLRVTPADVEGLKDLSEADVNRALSATLKWDTLKKNQDVGFSKLQKKSDEFYNKTSQQHSIAMQKELTRNLGEALSAHEQFWSNSLSLKDKKQVNKAFEASCKDIQAFQAKEDAWFAAQSAQK